MKKSLSLNIFNRLMICCLGIIFIAEGLNFVFKFGFNHHLYHLFWVVCSFNVGIYVGYNWIK